MKSYYIGYDIGSSSIKVSLVEAFTLKSVIAIHEPQNEMEIISLGEDWAEQDPDLWWNYVCNATKRALKKSSIKGDQIEGIGISYQMHGLVIIDSNGNPLRKAIIWCDGRAVNIGNEAFEGIGPNKCVNNLLNSPGNFTASKLKWVKENEPDIYSKIYKYMLPGDYIAYKLTGEIKTTRNGLSEGMLWDYKENKIADWLLDYYGIDKSLTPELTTNFENQGNLNTEASSQTGLKKGTPVIYRAGDQPNNALSLNVFKPGEAALTGGTSGVIYAVSDNLKSRESSRINSFAHVNYSNEKRNIGKLLCINGAGILYSWLRKNMGNSYDEMNKMAADVAIGSNGVIALPFGNGPERMLNNKNIGVHFANLNLNQHNNSNLYRSALEGIAFSFVYGMEILKNDDAKIDILRAGNDNLFRSEIFSNTVATLMGHDIEIYNTTGAIGAARAVGLKNGDFEKFGTSITANDYVQSYTPKKEKALYENAYQSWKKELKNRLNNLEIKQ